MTWRSIAARQSGLLTSSQLRAAGVTADAARAAVHRGELRRVRRGLYQAGGSPSSLDARRWAAVLATGGALCRLTAAHIWGITDIDDGVVHVAVRQARRVDEVRGVQIHRFTLMPSVERRAAGLPVVSRCDTVLDLLAVLPEGQASILLDRALQQRWIGLGDITGRLDAPFRRPGHTQLRVLMDRAGDGAAAKSERVLHSLLRRAGIGGWWPNYEVRVDGTVLAVVDVAFPRRRLAIEVDGMAYHVDVDRFRRDRTRQNALVSLGWTVLRFTWADLHERPGYVIATVKRLLAA